MSYGNDRIGTEREQHTKPYDSELNIKAHTQPAWTRAEVERPQEDFIFLKKCPCRKINGENDPATCQFGPLVCVKNASCDYVT